jgi:hypothetical protein
MEYPAHIEGNILKGQTWSGENCLFSERFFKPIYVPLQVECNNYNSVTS